MKQSRMQRSAMWVVGFFMTGLLATQQARSDTAWYSDLFPYRAKVTIQHTNVTANLANFPVLVQLTSTKLKVSSSGAVAYTFSDVGLPVKTPIHASRCPVCQKSRRADNREVALAAVEEPFDALRDQRIVVFPVRGTAGVHGEHAGD